jgi:hypothetical protein
MPNYADLSPDLRRDGTPLWLRCADRRAACVSTCTAICIRGADETA